jgi:hypothetical protein
MHRVLVDLHRMLDDGFGPFSTFNRHLLYLGESHELYIHQILYL